MDFKKLNEEIENLLMDINELYPKDAGEEITNFESYEQALDIIKKRYDENKSLAYCPNALKFDYNGNKYQLAVVLGIKEPNNGMNPHGLAHILDKHSYQYDGVPTEEDLIKAARNVKTVLNKSLKTGNYLFNPEDNKLIFGNSKFIYIICLAKDDDELTYLHTLFMTDKKDYLKRHKKRLNKKFRKGY